jgi:hypothetical protein
MGNYLDYRAALAGNREVFLLNQPRAVSTFGRIDRRFDKMIEALNGARTPAGKTQVSPMVMMLLMQRQFRAAFQSISSFQAYEAWLILRPAIEIPLIIGKWLDDRANVTVWKERASNPKEYRKHFSGASLRSQSLPESERIQNALSRLNDRFAHPNPDYCYRHVNVQPEEEQQLSLRIEYFDEEEDVKVAWLAMSHLMVIVQDRLWMAIASTLANADGHSNQVTDFETVFRKEAEAVATKSEVSRKMLEEIGLWLPILADAGIE